ncbi:hypothetical protein [Paenibacillus sp. YYML68]|uniref:hypothetical protein n=1 Tax=Paenibacillus sp. YYML68 TaxID=2909250 RepID=UPI00248FA293|nr:hypothetical protein [Paenibacillus sp. YYML68]
MIWIDRHRQELEAVFKEAEAVVSRLPAPFDSMGKRYLDKFTILNEDSTKNYICYLLPYWLQPLTGLQPRECSKLSLAGIFDMLYFFLADDVIDDGGAGARQKLTLGHLIHLEQLRLYQELFHSESPIWDYYRKYSMEWAHAVLHENERDYFAQETNKLAHKASPVKLTATACLMLSDRADRIAELEKLVDHVLTTLQLVDDWIDWEDDLKGDTYNALLAMVRTILPEDEWYSVPAIRRLVCDRGLFERYAEEAVNHHLTWSSEGSDLEELRAFDRFLAYSLVRDVAIMNEEKRQLTHGGIFYYLSKNLAK